MFRNEVDHEVASETGFSGCSETAAPRFGNRRLTLMGSIAVLVGGFIPMSVCGSPETVSANTEQPLVVTHGSAAPSVAPAGSTPTPEEVGAADKKLEEQLRSGWIPFGGAVPGVPGVRSPDSAWMRARGGIPSDSAEANAERVPIHDQPNGKVVGYLYRDLGYVPVEIADSGSFDSTDARVRKWGCDLRNDMQCKIEISRRIENDAQARTPDG